MLSGPALTEACYGRLFDTVGDAVVIVDIEQRIVEINAEAERVFGYTRAELRGQPLSLLVPARARALHPALFRSFVEGPADRRLMDVRRPVQGRRRDGSEFPAEVSIARFPTDGRLLLSAVVRDVSAMRRLQEELLQAHKLEAVGRLAGGIAHDFNNILTGIIGFTRLLLDDLEPGTPQRFHAERIFRAAERATDLARQILGFARPSPLDREPAELGPMIRDLEELLRASLPTTTRLEVETPHERLVTALSKGQLSQILINLSVNASQALAGEPGTVRIGLRTATPADRAAFERDDVAEAGQGFTARPYRNVVGRLVPERAYALVRIADTGSGMAPEVLERIFEPFYTTKETGRGSGLGLSVVHGVLLGADAACRVASRPGEGTVVSVFLPLVERPGPGAEAGTRRADHAGHERVLLVDDERDVLDVLAIGLRRLGYAVAESGDPQAALALFTADPSGWDVVVSDQVMPGMKGTRLLQSMRQTGGPVRFILCTGFSEEDCRTAILESGADRVLHKPVSIDELAGAIRSLCDAAAAPDAETDR